MSKQSTITNLLVMPLIASAVFLASPALASNQDQIVNKTVMNAHTIKRTGSGQKGIAGTVTSVSDEVILIQGIDKVTYTVDAGNAVVMKASTTPDTNPAVVQLSAIHVGDTVLVRGTVASDKTDITATKIFDGKMHGKNLKHKIHKLRKVKNSS